MNATLNGRRRPSLNEQIDRLDAILDGLADALNESVANAVRDAVGLAVREAVRAVVAEMVDRPEVALARANSNATVPNVTTTPRPTWRGRIAAGWRKVRSTATATVGWLAHKAVAAGKFVIWGVKNSPTVLVGRMRAVGALVPVILALMAAYRKHVTLTAIGLSANLYFRACRIAANAVEFVRSQPTTLVRLACLGVVVGLGCYLAGPVVASAVSGVSSAGLACVARDRKSPV